MKLYNYIIQKKGEYRNMYPTYTDLSKKFECFDTCKCTVRLVRSKRITICDEHTILMYRIFLESTVLDIIGGKYKRMGNANKIPVFSHKTMDEYLHTASIQLQSKIQTVLDNSMSELQEYLEMQDDLTGEFSFDLHCEIHVCLCDVLPVVGYFHMDGQDTIKGKLINLMAKYLNTKNPLRDCFV